MSRLLSVQDELAHNVTMQRGYKWLALGIVAASIAVASTIIVLRLTTSASTPQRGLYRQKELPSVVGYKIWLPVYVPAGLRQTDGYYVQPAKHFVLNEYDEPQQHGVVFRALGITMAPHGQLVQGKRGIGYDVHAVSVHHETAQADSWSTSGAHGQVDLKHNFRMLQWAEAGFDFQIYSWGLSDNDLARVANSMTPVP